MKTLQESIIRLIPIFFMDFDGLKMYAVNARDLYHYLGIKGDFNDWIYKQISYHDAEEHEDFVTGKLAEFHVNEVPARTEYYISLALAQDISAMKDKKNWREASEYLTGAEQLEMPDNIGATTGLLNTTFNEKILYLSVERLSHILQSGLLSINTNDLMFTILEIKSNLETELRNALPHIMLTRDNDAKIIEFIKNWKPIAAQYNTAKDVSDVS